MVQRRRDGLMKGARQFVARADARELVTDDAAS
jgi:hypothetical protein